MQCMRSVDDRYIQPKLLQFVSEKEKRNNSFGANVYTLYTLARTGAKFLANPLNFSNVISIFSYGLVGWLDYHTADTYMSYVIPAYKNKIEAI